MKIFRTLFFTVFIFSFSFSNSQSWNWAKFESLPVDPPPAQHLIAVDDSGNVYFSGEKYMIGLTKYDKNGNLLWSNIPVSYSSCDWSQSVAVSAGNEYITGQFKGTLILGKDTLKSIGDSEMFIAKYNPGGAEIWAKMSLGEDSIISGISVSADFAGDSYVTGDFKGTLIFGTDTFYAPYQSIYVVKYDPNGNYLWAKVGICPKQGFTGHSNAIWADSSGECFITGNYHGYMIFGSDTLPPTTISSNIAFFAAKYDANGNLIWLRGPKLMSASNPIYGNSISADNSGSAYLAGTAESRFIITPDTVKYGGPFYVKFNPNGSVSWCKQPTILDNNYWYSNTITTDYNSYNYLLLTCYSGSFPYKIAVDADTFKIQAYPTANVLFKFDSAGNFNCGSIFTEGQENDGDGMNASPSGQYVYMAGDIYYTGVFGTDTLNYSGFGESFYLASWQPCNSNIETGMHLRENNAEMKIFPNPSSGTFTLSLANNIGKCDIEIYNMMGEKVFAEILRSSQDDNLIELKNKSNGIYLYRVLKEDGSLVGEGKVIVQK